MDKTTIKSTGAVYTPPQVASAITNYIAGLVPARPLRVLEPSVGDGAFLNALSGTFAVEHCFTLIDIDASVIEQVREKLGVRPAALKTQDFILFATEHRRAGAPPYELVIGNPPFIRKHNYSPEFKENLEAFAECFEYNLPNLKNSWAAFLVAACGLVADDGIVAYVLPYELLTVAYGQTVLLDHMRPAFERIDIFVSDEKAFKDIDQDAVIFIGRKAVPDNDAGLFINRVASFDNLAAIRSYRLSTDATADRSLELSRFLLPEHGAADYEALRRDAPKISDFADSAPGIVSAANDYFILSEREVDQHGLADHVVPILKKGSLAGASPIFAPADFAQFAKREPCLLLTLSGSRAEFDQSLLDYLKLGEEQEIDGRYKCRNRKYWYEVPLVKRELGFFFKRSHSMPRVMINEANVFITDTAYGLRMKAGFTIRGLCFSFYTSLTMLSAEIDGRFYGGGVLELSPREFRGLPLIYHEPTDNEWQAFIAAHARADGDANQILDFGDRWLVRDHAISEETLQSVRQAWSSVRSHRMRHGSRSKQGSDDAAKQH